MNTEPDIKKEKEENLRKWEVSRRQMLKMMGGTAAASMAVAWLPNALRDDQPQDELVPSEALKDADSERRLRQWMMIIDQRFCDGCQSQGTAPQCTEACNFGHFVPEPMQWIEVYEHEMHHDEGEVEALRASTAPPAEGSSFMPTPCMQCQNPPCVNVCPVGATWTTPEGITLIDQNRCIGCRMCMAACPYERRSFTWGEPPTHPATEFIEHSVEHQLPMKKGVVYKCDFCPEMARAGRLPFCASGCPNNAIYYGDLEEDIATNGDQVVRISEFLTANSAYRHKEELGTRPRVYYIEGHGELVGRDPRNHGLAPVRWVDDENEHTDHWERSVE